MGPRVEAWSKVRRRARTLLRDLERARQADPDYGPAFDWEQRLLASLVEKVDATRAAVAEDDGRPDCRGKADNSRYCLVPDFSEHRIQHGETSGVACTPHPQGGEVVLFGFSRKSPQKNGT